MFCYGGGFVFEWWQAVGCLDCCKKWKGSVGEVNLEGMGGMGGMDVSKWDCWCNCTGVGNLDTGLGTPLIYVWLKNLEMGNGQRSWGFRK